MPYGFKKRTQLGLVGSLLAKPFVDHVQDWQVGKQVPVHLIGFEFKRGLITTFTYMNLFPVIDKTDRHGRSSPITITEDERHPTTNKIEVGSLPDLITHCLNESLAAGQFNNLFLALLWFSLQMWRAVTVLMLS